MRSRFLLGTLALLAIVAACVGSDPDPVKPSSSSSSSGGTSSSGTSGSGTSGTTASSSSGEIKPGPFTLTLAENQLVLPRSSGSASVKVSAVRQAGFDGEITIDVTTLPSGVTFDPLTIKDSDGVLTLRSNAATSGQTKLGVVGKSAQGSATASLDLLVAGERGERDESFGKSDVVYEAGSGASFEPAAVIVQKDGKVVVGGTNLKGGVPHFQLVRFKVDGSLDPNFGKAGVTDVDDAIVGPLALGRLTALTLQPGSGGLIAAGHVNETSQSAKVLRFDPAGKLDATFATTGAALITEADISSNPSIFSHGLTPLPDDSFLLLASHTDDSIAEETYLAHYSATGVLDPNWTGARHFTVYGYDEDSDTIFSSAIVASDGTIMAAGTFTPNDTQRTFIKTFSDAGAPISVTGDLSLQQLPTNNGFTHAVRQANSRLLTVGDIVETDGTHLYVVDLSPNGSQLQQVTVKTSHTDRSAGLVATNDGRYLILASGSPALGDGGLATSSSKQTKILRLKSATMQDLDWGPGTPQKGVVDVFALETVPVGLALAPDQRIVVAGKTTVGLGQDAKTQTVLRRLWP